MKLGSAIEEADERARVMPLFRCDGCNMRIERSMEAYWRNKGRLLCSSCRDQRDLSLTSGRFRDNDDNNDQTI
ncbi:MAG: hypothetical protein CMN95_06030 [Synechococcus sp. MED650]|nr:hypothetical protein [Synechococcus sp. MED650]OUW54630.1 MAG: hypothetical protein CBD48_04650 [Cyanobacteria bacterium TMED188]